MSLWDALRPRPTAEAVVREHAPRVYQWLRRIFGPRADIDDVFQMVFVEVLRALPGFQGRSRLSTWIRRITWNVAYQEMRTQYRLARTCPLDEEQLPASFTAAEDQLADNLARQRLYAELAHLSPRLRMVVVLHDIEGHTLREIARALGRPLPTVGSQLQTGRAQLGARMRQAPSHCWGSRPKQEAPRK